VDICDDVLIDIDLVPLAEAIYGGSQADPAWLQRALAERGIALPCHVVAVYLGEAGAAPPPGPALVDLHPNLAYLFPRQPRAMLADLDRAGLLHGEAVAAADPSGVVHAIQRAVVALRGRELARHRGHGTRPDAASEREARAIALQRLRLHADDAPLTTWLDCCLLCHHTRLVAARRRLLEFLAAATVDLDPHPDLDHAFDRGVRRLTASYAFSDLRRALLASVAECLPFLRDRAQGQSELVRRALRVLAARCHRPIALADVARAVHVSPAHLARRVKAETGRTVIGLLHERRLATARRLLLEGDEGILAIALASGFPSVEHFHRVFKRHTGTTPGRWRDAHRG